MTLPIIQVDAFTDRPFAGNPAAVCVLPEAGAWRDAQWMQQVAREMSLSETAFALKQADGFGLRWFTPAVEVDLCGHATLASAHVLWEEGHQLPEEPVRFHTRSGLLVAMRRDRWIELDFPAEPARAVDAPAGLARALGLAPQDMCFVGRNRFDYLVELASETHVRQLAPDSGLLRAIPTRGVIVTSRMDSGGFDVVSRFFAPRVGVDEDPVTGSAHCCLGPFWSGRLGKDAILAYQASARGGVVRVRVRGDRVGLAGQAVTVLRGELLY
jgi:PhzF family phenazine biosynthesis protein